jgi:hypothetical protein
MDHNEESRRELHSGPTSAGASGWRTTHAPPAHPPARKMGRQYTPRAWRWNTQSMRPKKRRERGGMAAGIAIGTGIGAAVGAATGQLAVWLGVGAGLGIALGAFLTAGLHMRRRS